MDSHQIDDTINAHFKWLETKGLAGARANLAGADMSGMDIPGIDLSGANLSEANLTDINLTGAVLDEANLAKSNLAGARLNNADLSRAVLSGASCFQTNFSGAKTFDLRWDGAWLFQTIVDYDQLPGRMETISYVALPNSLRLELLRRNMWAADPELWPRVKEIDRNAAFLPQPFKHPWEFMMPRGLVADHIEGKDVTDRETWQPRMTDFEINQALKDWLHRLDKEALIAETERDDHGFYKAA